MPGLFCRQILKYRPAIRLH